MAAEEREQRLKALRLLLGKSIQKLAQNEINSTADAIRGLGTAVRELRAEYAESPETAGTSVEEIIKRHRFISALIRRDQVIAPGRECTRLHQIYAVFRVFPPAASRSTS